MPLYWLYSARLLPFCPASMIWPRVHAEVRHPVVDFIDGREELPANAEIDGQLVADAPVVLDKPADGVIALTHRAGESQPVAHVRGQSEEEVGFGIARVGAGEADLPGGAVVAGCRNVVVAIADQLEADAAACARPS